MSGIKRPGKEKPKRVIPAELARILGTSRKTISEWASKEGFPKAEEGAYSVFEVMVWYLVEHSKQLVEPGVGGRDIEAEKDLAELQYRAAKAGMAEVDLRRRQGELISREAITEVLGTIASGFRDAGNEIGKISEEARERLLEAIDRMDDALERLSDAVPA